jgi:hypothetical protein
MEVKWMRAKTAYGSCEIPIICNLTPCSKAHSFVCNLPADWATGKTPELQTSVPVTILSL